MSNKKLYLLDDKKLAGVCGGVAEYFDLDVTLVRVGYVLLSLFSSCFPGLLLYIIMAIIVPKKTEYEK